MSGVEAQKYAEITAAEFQASAHALAERLRAMADKVEAAAVRGTPSTAASLIVNEIMWGLANAGLGGLVQRAADAEKAPAEATS